MVECIRKRLTIRLVFLKHLQADRSISTTQQFPNQTSPKKPLGLSHILESPLPSHGSNFKPHFPPMNMHPLAPPHPRRACRKFLSSKKFGRPSHRSHRGVGTKLGCISKYLKMPCLARATGHNIIVGAGHWLKMVRS